MSSHLTLSILLAILPIALSVDFILYPDRPSCTLLISSFDPIKVQAIFPAIANKQDGQHFLLTLLNEKEGEVEQTLTSQDNRVYRNNFYLKSNIIYSLCIQFITQRSLNPHDVIFVGFLAEQHFQGRIGKVQIPHELANEQNLKIMYQTSERMLQLNVNTIKNQKKERELQDKLVGLSLHKGNRIVTITIFECFIIIISGVYQIFALRRFLIEKNLY